MGLMQVVRPTQALPLWLLGTLLCSRLLAAGGALSDASALLQRHPDLPVAAEVEDNILHMDTGLVPAKGHGIKDRDAAGSTGKLLIFIAVGNSKEVMKAVAANIDHLRRTCGGVMDVFLAHYDNNRESWKEHAPTWFEQNVKYSVEAKGHKLGLAQQLLPKVLAKQLYEWVWLLDEDLVLIGIHTDLLIIDARASGAAIVQPALRQPAPRTSPSDPPMLKVINRGEGECKLGDPRCGLLAPSPDCRLRHTNFVEAMAPLVTPAALLKIFNDCDACIQDAEVTPVDMMWCSWMDKRLGMVNSACAVLDQVPMRHHNLKTLPAKYTEGSHKKNKKTDLSVIHKKDMISAPSQVKVYQCDPMNAIPDSYKNILARAKHEVEEAARQLRQRKLDAANAGHYEEESPWVEDADSAPEAESGTLPARPAAAKDADSAPEAESGKSPARPAAAEVPKMAGSQNKSRITKGRHNQSRIAKGKHNQSSIAKGKHPHTSQH